MLATVRFPLTQMHATHGRIGRDNWPVPCLVPIEGTGRFELDTRTQGEGRIVRGASSVSLRRLAPARLTLHNQVLIASRFQ
jgi:hypothetical protein